MLSIFKSTSRRAEIFKQVIVLIAKLSIFFLLLISIILFGLNKFQPAMVEPAKIVIMDLFSPLIRLAQSSIRSITVVYDEIGNILSAHSSAKQLKVANEENMKLKLAVFELSEENAKLRKGLNFLPPENREFYTARIISRNPGPFVHSAFIKSPDVAKIQKDNVVLNSSGLVGQVEEVGSFIANMIMITDKRSNVPVKAKNSGKRAILIGTGDKNPELDYVLSTRELIVGEEILTSGDGGVFPPDIPVGYIEKIENDRVVIASYVDFSSLEYVFIIK